MVTILKIINILTSLRNKGEKEKKQQTEGWEMNPLQQLNSMNP